MSVPEFNYDLAVKVASVLAEREESPKDVEVIGEMYSSDSVDEDDYDLLIDLIYDDGMNDFYNGGDRDQYAIHYGTFACGQMPPVSPL